MRTRGALSLALMLAACSPAYPGEPKVYTKWPFDAAEARRRQAETAKALGVEVERDIEIAPGVKMRFVLIPAGEFMMGSPEGEKNLLKDELLHRVRITQPFWMGKYEVTVEQFRAFVQSTRHQTDGEKAGKAFGYKDGKHGLYEGITWANALPDQTDAHPVTCVSWHDADAFCAWLSRKAGSTCRLPTEAEWEYACRAGTSTPFHFGDTISTDEANYDGDDTYGNGRKGLDREKTVTVGSFPANAWGLYDMHGNVWEWCADWYYDEAYYASSPISDPGEAAEYRVLRGGSWRSPPRYCRSALRGRLRPAGPYSLNGFRVVLPAAPSR